MRGRFASSSEKPSVGLIERSKRLVLLLLPVPLLAVASLRVADEADPILWLGTLFQVVACGLALWNTGGGREPAGPAVIMLYVIALGWMLLGAPNREDWVIYLSQSLLLVVPLAFFALQCLHDSGATMLRKARQLAARLAERRDWPADLQACQALPEVKALREALHLDASPALELLANPRPAVRVAALAALEFRPGWRPGQPQVVLQLARRAPEPEVRAAAISALANVEDRLLIEPLAELLRDPSPLVRQTTTEALMWNTEGRWPWIRHAVRHALADPACEEDGALRLAGNTLTNEAIADFHAWAAEKGLVALRAALTLGAYYEHVLTTNSTPELLKQLRDLLADPRTPAMLRLELTRLMNAYRELNEDDLRRLMEPSMPAPVRLIAVEALLGQGQSPEALAALHDLARLPNREIALATADVVQRHLGIDLGLPRDQPPPPVESRSAAEVARRVLAWASAYDVSNGGSATAAKAGAFHPSETSSRVNL
jgi:HEAT repeat protein